MPADKKKAAQLHPQLTAIQQQLQSLLNSETAAKQSFQGLYQELEEYKNDFLFRHERVLLQDLLLFYDSLLWFVEESKSNPEQAEEYAQYLIDEFLEVLRRRDVLPVEPQDRFDRKYHRIISTEPTDNESKDKHIVEVHRRGFHRGEQLVRAEEVVIFRYDKALVKGESTTISDTSEPEAESTQAQVTEDIEDSVDDSDVSTQASRDINSSEEECTPLQINLSAPSNGDGH